MKIAFLMMRHPPTHQNPVTREMLQLLSEMGADVEVIYPEDRVVDLAGIRPEHDLYVLKSRTEMSLGLAGVLHAAGAAILNPYPVSALLRDKITLARVLQAAGVPTPETFVTAHPEMLAPLLDAGPLVVKGYRGSGLRGVHLVWDVDDLDDVPTNQGPVLAQRLKERRGRARQIYCIGGQLFGVARAWPAQTYEERMGQPFTVNARLREAAHRCAQALGIEVFGLDIIGDDEDPYVVDVHGFPGFKGVPNAALRLADYVYDAARHAQVERAAAVVGAAAAAAAEVQR